MYPAPTAAVAPDRPAFIMAGSGETVTYGELEARTNRLAHYMRDVGLRRLDHFSIFMENNPRFVECCGAGERSGLYYTCINSYLTPEELAYILTNSRSRVLITSTAKRETALKAMAMAPGIERCLIVDGPGDGERIANFDEATAGFPHTPIADEYLGAGMLYSSGTTGKPKGVLHTTAGYLLGTAITTKYVFDLKENDVYFCTADVGWITGHSYVVYGPLANGATVFMYEGAPNQPGPDRFWDMIDRHQVSIFYTAPTAIRAFMRWGDEHVKRHSLKSLRLLGSVGEPINPEAWMWYHTLIGKKRCPIVDTWWQTETGAIMVSPLPGVTPTKPGSCTRPFFGVVPKVLDEKGVEVPKGSGGRLFLSQPWPSMLRTLWGDDERYKKQYWSELPGYYFAGDGARFDKDGYLWVVGRIDDVLNVSGHRIGTAEIESALVSHPTVAEAAVVGRPDDLKGQALVCFVTLKNGIAASPELKETLRQHVAREIGALARPDDVRFATGLPKTRSGKIMRRILKEIATGGDVKGDTTTLEDFSVVAALQHEE